MSTKTLPTSLDYVDLSYFITQRMKLASMHKGVTQFPQIFTHCSIKITPTSRDKAIWEEGFNEAALDVEIEYNPEFCTQISCNSHVRGGGECTYGFDQPSAFISYDTTYSQCEPACWAWGDTIVRPDLTKTDSFMTFWNDDQKKCYYGNQAYFMFLTDPVARSKARWDRHVNTLPTGFAAKVDSTGKMTATLDPVYCKEFNMDYSGGACRSKVVDTVLSFTPLGSTLVSLVRSAINNNWETEPKPYDRQPDPSSLPATKLDRNAWKKLVDSKYVDIDPNVTLSALGFSPDLLSNAQRGSVYYHNKENSLIRVFNLVKTPDVYTQRRREFFNLHTTRSLKEVLQDQRELITQYMNGFSPAVVGSSEFKTHLMDRLRPLQLEAAAALGREADNPFPEGSPFATIYDDLVAILGHIPSMIVHMCEDWVTLVGTMGNVALTEVLKQIKNLCLDIIDGSLHLLVVDFVEKISQRLLEGSVQVLMVHVASRIVSAFSGKILLFMARSVVAFVDFIDIFGILTMLVDIAWAIADPFGFNKAITDDSLVEIHDALQAAQQKQGATDIEVTPLLFHALFQSALSKYGADDYVSTYDATEPTELTRRFINRHTKPKLDNLYTKIIANQPLFKYYEDDSAFILSISNAYLRSRTVNSEGHPFNWDTDLIDLKDNLPEGLTLAQTMLHDFDLKTWFSRFNYRQLLLTLLLLSFGVLCLFGWIVSWSRFLITIPVALALVCKFSSDNNLTAFLSALTVNLV